MRKNTFTLLRTRRTHDTLDKSLRTFSLQAMEMKSVFRTTQLVHQLRGLNLWPLLND